MLVTETAETAGLLITIEATAHAHNGRMVYFELIDSGCGVLFSVQ